MSEEAVNEATESTATDTSESVSETEDSTSLDGLTSETDIDASSETSEVEGEGIEDSGKSDEEAGKTVEIDPELLTFATAKKYTEDDLKNPNFVQSVKAQREMERRMNQLDSENARYKREELTRAAQVVEGNTPSISPVAELTGQIEAQLSLECQAHGCSNLSELQQNFPEVYNYFKTLYHEKLPEAQDKAIDWKFNQRDSEAQKSEHQQILDNELREIKDQSQQMLQGYRQSNPNIDQQMIKSGAVSQISRLSKLTGILPEYFHADKAFMDFMVESSKAIDLIRSGELQKRAKKETEKAIDKAKKAEMPASGSPLPDDHEALRFAQLQRSGTGVSF